MSKMPHRRRWRRGTVAVLAYVLPIALLLALLTGLLLRDALRQPPPPPAIHVVVQPQPEEIIPPERPVRSVFKVQIHDEPPVFDPSLTLPPPLVVNIIDEKEERALPKPPPVKVEIIDESNADDAAGKPIPAMEVDPRPRVVWQYGPGMRFGIAAVETRKLLTYALNGATNQTLLRVNGQIGEFGGPMGTFTERDTRLPPDSVRKTHGGSKSVWVSGKIHYTQILELTPSGQPTMVGSQPKLLLDTVRVRYLIENKDNKTFRAGMRMQVDTLIGGNDGVPFTVPGLTSLVTSFADFPRAGPIPDFIQALERPNLRDPGTVAHMSLQLGGAVEAPNRVSLTHWPGAGYPNWEVPLLPLASDSAVVLYWNDRPLLPGEIREMGFAYGLGSVVSSDPSGSLGVTLGGGFEPGEIFTVTAYIQGAKKGQTLTLEVPSGLERIGGNEVQSVPPPAPSAANSIVTWKVKVLRTGNFPLKVVSSNGLSQAKTISIVRPEGSPPPKLAVDLSGSFEPGQQAKVQAKLTSSDMGLEPGQPTLTVPAGLEIREESGVDVKESSHFCTWKVKVLEPGKHSVRVEWCGAAVTKTLSIVQPKAPVGGYVSMSLTPPFAPGKAFGVTATVSDPIPGQTLTLRLPSALCIVEGKQEATVEATEDGRAVVEWKVLVDKPGTYPLRLESSAGLTLKKTIVIEQGEEKGGEFKLNCLGDIAPGKEFTVRATVTNPLKEQKLTLMPLPMGLELVEGPATKSVPPPDKPDKLSEVTWRIRVLDIGVWPVRVTSTTGMVQSFTIDIMQERIPEHRGELFGGKAQ
jgi:hypothetical protein